MVCSEWLCYNVCIVLILISQFRKIINLYLVKGHITLEYLLVNGSDTKTEIQVFCMSHICPFLLLCLPMKCTKCIKLKIEQIVLTPLHYDNSFVVMVMVPLAMVTD